MFARGKINSVILALSLAGALAGCGGAKTKTTIKDANALSQANWVSCGMPGAPACAQVPGGTNNPGNNGNYVPSYRESLSLLGSQVYVTPYVVNTDSSLQVKISALPAQTVNAAIGSTYSAEYKCVRYRVRIIPASGGTGTTEITNILSTDGSPCFFNYQAGQQQASSSQTLDFSGRIPLGSNGFRIEVAVDAYDYKCRGALGLNPMEPRGYMWGTPWSLCPVAPGVHRNHTIRAGLEIFRNGSGS